VELAAPTPAKVAEFVIEFESSHGAKTHIQCSGSGEFFLKDHVTARVNRSSSCKRPVAEHLESLNSRYRESLSVDECSQTACRHNDSLAICMIVENLPVPPDRRVWKEALALREAGYRVAVICPKGHGFMQSYEILDSIEVFRHSKREGSSRLDYVFEYIWALVSEFLLTLKVYIRTPFRVIHACNPPDLIFLIGIFFKLFGVRFIFDHHDPAPELYEVKFGRKGFFYRLVQFAERLTFAIADVVISSNESLRQIAIKRGGVSEQRSYVVQGCPDLRDFSLISTQIELKEGHKYLVVYLGYMGTQDGVDLLLDSIGYLVHSRRRTDTLFVFIGSGTEKPRLQTRASELGVDNHVRFTGALYGDRLLAYLASADVGVAPDPSNSLNDKLTMIKIFEYMACGLPIVLFDLPEGHRTAGDAALYAKANDPIHFGEQIQILLDSESLRRQLGERGWTYVRRGLNWSAQKPILLRAYADCLASSHLTP